MKKDKLHNIKSTGFKIPDQYLESFDDKLFECLNKNESINDIETSGYKVPKDYFDSVEDNILSRLNTEDTSIISLKYRKTFYYIAGIAASLVLLFSIFIKSERPEDLISVEMVEVYLENRDLNSYELAQLLSDIDLLEDDFEIIKPPYEEDNLESYLLEHSDIESILE
jgi:hypothetical protein